MQKEVYSITKLGKVENTKITGVGHINDEELITAQISGKMVKAYIRTFDCIKNCRQITGTTDEYKGTYFEIIDCVGRDIQIIYYN